ncbi:MAG: carboxymuconolactone decarboxylase family protein [Longimicrobiales bacterium]
MDDALRALIVLSVALGRGGRDCVAHALDRAAASAPREAIEEALLQSYLFIGYPAALNAIATWRERSGAPPPAPAEDAWAAWLARGEQTCERVYGGQYDKLRRNVAALHPDLERWMLVEGYGKVLARPGLDLAARELCVAALLAAQDAAPQLHAHLRGALNAGAPVEAVEAAVACMTEELPAERSTTLQLTWSHVLSRWQSKRLETPAQRRGPGES